MRQFSAICSRNLKIYLRDWGSIFFSFLSMLIVIGLMMIFLGDVTVDSILDAVKMIPGRGGKEDADAAANLIYLWTIGGIIAINASTITLAFYSNMIKDRNGNRLNSILVMPINRAVIVAGYIISAWVVSVVMGIITLFVTEGIGVARGIEMFTFTEHLELMMITMVNSLVYSAVMYFFASLIKTEGAWSGFGIVVGTLVGFLGGIYFPIGSLSDTVANVVKCFPMIYGTSLYRNVMMKRGVSDFLQGVPEGVDAILKEKMGITLSVFEKSLSTGEELVILIGVGALFALLSVVYVKFCRKTDR